MDANGAVGYNYRTQVYDGWAPPQTDHAVSSFQWLPARSATGPEYLSGTESRSVGFTYADPHVYDRQTTGGSESPQQSHRPSSPRSSPSATYYNFFPDSEPTPPVDNPRCNPPQLTPPDTCLQLFPRVDHSTGNVVENEDESDSERRRGSRSEDVIRHEEDNVTETEGSERNRDREQDEDGWGGAAEGQEFDHRHDSSAHPHWRPAKKRLISGGGDKHRSYLGVRMRAPGRWTAEMKDIRNKVRQWLGTHDSAEEAAIAYDSAIRKIRGAHGKTNFLYPGHTGPSVFNIPVPDPVHWASQPPPETNSAGVGDVVGFRDGFSSSTRVPKKSTPSHYSVSQKPRFIVPKLHIYSETANASTDASGDTCHLRQSPTMATSPAGVHFPPSRTSFALLSPMAMSALKATSAMAENQSGAKDLPWALFDANKAASSELPAPNPPTHPTPLGWEPWRGNPASSDTRRLSDLGLSLSGPRIRQEYGRSNEDLTRGTQSDVYEGLNPSSRNRNVGVGGNFEEGAEPDGKWRELLSLLKEQFDKAGKGNGDGNNNVNTTG